MAPRTLFDKIWDAHVVERLGDESCILYIDRHLLDDLHSPQAFAELRRTGRPVRRPDATIAVSEHTVPTRSRDIGAADASARLLIETLEADATAFGVPHIPLSDRRQGIVHVIGPELGLALPGLTVLSGDSHASTQGAVGALAFGVGASDVEQALATQTIVLTKPRSMKVEITGRLAAGVSAKDLALAIVATLGASGAMGHVIEFCGEAVGALDMAGRMTLCNLAIETGARTALIAPDAVTFAYLQGRDYAPPSDHFASAVAYWQELVSDAGAVFDRVVALDASGVVPMVTWGTNPETSVPIMGVVPAPEDAPDAAARAQRRRMLEYMGLAPGQALLGLPVDVVFIGSCANGRIEDIRDAARVAQGRRVASGVRALVVPGSGRVKEQAEQEGLDRVLLDAGFEWHGSGCSLCIAMNGDRLAPGRRCASTSNRNFEGRQGPGARTHLLSPAMAAAAAVYGRLVDIRSLD
ncbi:MAG: 3-isopropylmalate dehydratase large subunit [Acetobacteraceae bacterium]